MPANTQKASKLLNNHYLFFKNIVCFCKDNFQGTVKDFWLTIYLCTSSPDIAHSEVVIWFLTQINICSIYVILSLKKNKLFWEHCDSQQHLKPLICWTTGGQPGKDPTGRNSKLLNFITPVASDGQKVARLRKYRHQETDC